MGKTLGGMEICACFIRWDFSWCFFTIFGSRKGLEIAGDIAVFLQRK